MGLVMVRVFSFFFFYFSCFGRAGNVVIGLSIERTMLMRFLGVDKKAKQVESSTPKKGYYDPVRNGTL